MSKNFLRIKKAISYEVISMGVIVFFAAILPRASSLRIHETYDEGAWLSRSVQFIAAIEKLDLQKTLVSYHPGVTTAWIGGIALRLKSLFVWEHTWISDLATARFGIVFVTSLTIFGMYFLMRKLFNSTIAFISALLMALDLYYIAHSSLLHTDALLTSFMLSSVLSFLVYLDKDSRLFYGILSGIFCGLACLTKMNAFFLFPFTLIILLLHYWLKNRKIILLQFCIRLFLGWSATSVLTFCILWPWTWIASVRAGEYTLPVIPIFAPLMIFVCYWGIIKQNVWGNTGNLYSILMWIIAILPFVFLPVVVWVANPAPVHTARQFFNQAHNIPQVFLGELYYDPGPFYLTFVGIMRIPLMILICMFLSSIFLFYGTKAKKSRWILLILWLYVILFDISVSVPAKKLPRYILPIAPAIDILAAYALYHLVNDLISKPQVLMFINRKLPNFKAVANTTVLTLLIYATPVLYQLSSGLSIRPYYLAYYSSISSLWGGRAIVPSLIRVGRGEGLNKVWEYLDSKKGEAKLLFDVGLELQDDLDERLLFSTDLTFGSNFDIPAIWENLQQEFAKNGFLLSDEAGFLPEEIGRRWRISDKHGVYIVKKEENKLNIYNISVSADWHREFRNNGTHLPQNATVAIEKRNESWLITGIELHGGPRGVTLCSIRKEKGRLNVYGAEYVILYVRLTAIGYPEEDIMRYYVNEIPEHVVRLGGIEYAWIYENKDKVR